MPGDMLIDTYEPPFFHEALGDLGTKIHMKTGDYVWSGHDGESWAIERKEWTDLINSFGSGRLTDQCQRMIETYKTPILLAEGIRKATNDGLIMLEHGIREYRYSMIEQVLLEVQMAGMFLIQSPSKKQSVEVIRALYKFSQRADHSLINKRAKPFQIGTRVDNQVFLLMGLPGIGEDTARSLLSAYKTPMSAMMNLVAAHTNGAEVPVKGVGAKKIEAVAKTLMGDAGITKFKG